MRLMITAICFGVLSACQAGVPNYVILCEQTVRDYALLRDEGPAEAYADLFTQEGTFELGGTITAGRQALISRHKSANAEAAWRHSMSDIRISKTDKTVTGISRFNVKTGPHLDTPSAEVKREILGDYIDEFEVKGGVCKIKSRKVKIVFDTLFVKPRRQPGDR